MLVDAILHETFDIAGISAVKEFAEQVGVSERQILRWRKEKCVPRTRTINEVYDQLRSMRPEQSQRLSELEEEMIKVCIHLRGMPFVRSEHRAKGDNDVLQRADNDFILGKKFRFNTKTLDHARNNNVFVVGMSGKGKTSCIVEPNLLQRNASYIVADAKGQIVNTVGGLLQMPGTSDDGYDIRILNLKDPSCSFHYNPFRYIRNENDCVVLGRIIGLSDCDGNRTQSYDAFWDNAKTQLLTALIYYLWKFCPEAEQNFANLLRLLKLSGDGVDCKSLKNLLRCCQDNDFLSVYAGSMLAAPDRTLACIISEVYSSVAPLAEPAVSEMMLYDELHLEDFAERNTTKIPSLFVVCDDILSNKNFIACMLYKQLFELLCEHADRSPLGRLPFPVRFFLDDFTTLGQIPDFSNLMSNMRSRNISVVLMVQNENQLQAVYGNQSENIIENCNYYVCLGGNSLDQQDKTKRRFGRRMFERNRDKGFYLVDNTKRLYNIRPLHYQEHPNWFSYPFNYVDYVQSRKEKGSPASLIDLEALRLRCEIESEELDNVSCKGSVLDSYAEKELYSVISRTVESKYVIIPHCHLNELVEPNCFCTLAVKKRLSMMHCDLMVFDKDDMKPVCGIECDGPSHDEPKQKALDEYKDRVFERIGVPLLRIKVGSFDFDTDYDAIKVNVLEAVKEYEEHKAEEMVNEKNAFNRMMKMAKCTL